MLTSLAALSVLLLLVAATDRTAEADEAAISDPKQECKAYYYAPAAGMISSFPPVWHPATILKGDHIAQDKWNTIAPNVPTIQPKGTPTGNFTNVTYASADPDCWWTYHQCTTPKLAGLPPDIVNVPEPNTLGYGFDDGPNCSHNAFYDYLTEQNQRATMFYIGSNVLDWPLEAQRAVTDGHEICVHTWSHRYMTALSSVDAFAELYYTLQAIKLATGVTPACWRPPFGDVDDRIRSIANGLGLHTIVWEYDSDDWKVGIKGVTADTVNSNYQDLVNGAKNGTFATEGAMILTHELNNYTMQTAMEWYPKLKAAFQYIVPVAVAYNKTQPYAETEYTMPSFSEYINGARQSSSSSGTTTSKSSQSPAPAPPTKGTHHSSGPVSGAASRLQPADITWTFGVAFIATTLIII